MAMALFDWDEIEAKPAKRAVRGVMNRIIHHVINYTYGARAAFELNACHVSGITLRIRCAPDARRAMNRPESE